MKVFITGATGFIGQGVIPELLKNGHSVAGLARDSTKASLLESQGVEAHIGDLSDISVLKDAARNSDAILHLGYVHDFANMADSTSIDRAAIEAFAEGFAGENKILIIAGGVLYLPRGVVGTEETLPMTDVLHGRAKSEYLLAELAKEKGFRGVVARFSPSVHGAGDHGFVDMLGNLSKKSGVVPYIGDGTNKWPAVHRVDVAVFLRLIIEKAHQTKTASYHAVSEEGIKVKDIMGAIASKTNLPLKSMSKDEATPVLGWFAEAISWDNPSSSEITRRELGWKPNNIGLVEDIEKNYF